MSEDGRTTHPAYGVVNIHRIQGHTRLFQSDFAHHNYISLKISTAEKVERHGVSSVAWPVEEIIEINMSESQFARTITSLNMGEGAPCTIGVLRMPSSLAEYANQRIPPLEQNDIRKTHKDKVNELISDRLKELVEIQNKLVAWRKAKHRPTLSELDDIIKNLHATRMPDNFAYIQEVLEEKMEQTIEEGHTEIEAHITQILTRVGLDKVQREALPETPFEANERETPESRAITKQP